jgi:glycosyltransferase involved in cell wall biosynthesis
MRVLFAVHHPLDERLGAPSVSLAIGAALTRVGHDVEYHGYDQAYPGRTQFSSRHQLAYPWKLASFLRENSGRFDVLDVTTGDAYVWDRLGRPGGGRPALVTRSNGLEHLASRKVRDEAKAGRIELSWKYPLYYGGWRLREVRRSLQCADGVLLLTEEERTYATELLRVEPARIRVVPHGINTVFLEDEPVLRESRSDEPVHLCFIGNWYSGKGAATVVQVTQQLVSEGVPFDLLIAGSGLTEHEVLRWFAPGSAAHVTVVPRYSSAELVGLLADRELLIFPSPFEGFGIAVLEAMARGVAPIATPVGLIPSVISDGVNGLVMPHQRPDLIAATVRRLAADRSELLRLRTAARTTARVRSWDAAARETLTLYELTRGRRAKNDKNATGRER